MDLLNIIALLVLGLHLFIAADLFAGLGRMRRLSGLPPAEGAPMVSVIVAACNEERNIAAAVKSLLAQDYRRFEIIVVNDRSTDGTGTILAGLAAAHENLTVIAISELPEGWLGKAHALHTAAGRARGELLLFTDADVIMEKSTISRAAACMQGAELAHLCLIFKNISKGWLLNSLILDSGAGLFLLFRPWKAADRRSRRFIGVGAFNMVRREVYEAVGGHSSIRLHPIDDIMLGKIIKRAGYAQECLLGLDLVKVPWYDSVAAMVEGLMKNVLAMINYRFLLLPPLLAVMTLLNMAPLWGLILASGSLRWLCAAAVVVRVISSFFGTRLLSLSPWCAPATLLTPYLSVYILLRAAWRNYRDDGIIWRGTRYPLDRLRDNEPILP